MFLQRPITKHFLLFRDVFCFQLYYNLWYVFLFRYGKCTCMKTTLALLRLNTYMFANRNFQNTGKCSQNVKIDFQYILDSKLFELTTLQIISFLHLTDVSTIVFIIIQKFYPSVLILNATFSVATRYTIPTKSNYKCKLNSQIACNQSYILNQTHDSANRLRIHPL